MNSKALDQATSETRAAPRPPGSLLLSVIVLNYNGAKWISRCLESLRAQTICTQIELLVADNQSTDGSDATAEMILKDWPNARFIQNGENLGFAEGNNRPAATARGEFLFFLNNDAWLEPDCLDKLVAEVRRTGAAAATAQVLDYGDDTFQSLGAAGFDVFGLVTVRRPHAETRQVLMPEGCSYLIQRALFLELGGFDARYFMFAEECDLSWRVWLSGRTCIAVPAARLHHRGAADANPEGGTAVVEFRTSDSKRSYANRNALLTLLKNGQNLLLLLVPLQLALLLAEALVGLVLIRRGEFIKRAYLDAIADCWRLRKHILGERRRIRQFRRRGDFWMLRFLRLRLNRWDEIQRMRRFGLPKVTPR